MGKIQSTLVEAEREGEARKTPLGEQLDEFGKALSYVIGGICVAVWAASIPRFTDSVRGAFVAEKDALLVESEGTFDALAFSQPWPDILVVGVRDVGGGRRLLRQDRVRRFVRATLRGQRFGRPRVLPR
ncbi:hypothetical protein ACHAWF_012761 [Thalassiosira exigua]